MRLLAFLAILIAAAAAPAVAQNREMPNVSPVAEVEGLRISLVHTADRDAFYRAWNAGARDLPVTNRAVRGRQLAVIVIFQGCRAAADGKCNLTGEFTYLRPDGSVEGKIDGTLWARPPARDGSASASPEGPALEIDPYDPMGTWTVRVRVTDNVRGVSVETEAQLIVDTPPTRRRTRIP